MQADLHSAIDIPFNYRHTCWFCGEPTSTSLNFPRSAKSRIYLEHALLTIPACKECASFQYPSDLSSIWALRTVIKQALISKYTSHLAIGENWTEQELMESDFSGAILGGFGESAWHMYEIAKQRIAYQGWLVSVDSLPIDAIDDTCGFEFEGTNYASLSQCIQFFTSAIDIDRDLLSQLVDIVTPSRFDYALKIAKVNKHISASKREQIVEEVMEQESERLAFSQLAHSEQSSLIEEVAVSGAVAPIFAIEWALEKGAYTLGELCNLEDAYFDDFAHLGGAAAFASYNGLQLYLDARANPAWVEAHDPNRALWPE